MLLGMIVEASTGKTASEYCATKLWGPLKAENDASWGLDANGKLEKFFSAFYATPRDYAKLGQLIQHDGRIHGVQIVDSAYLSNALSPCNIPDSSGDRVRHYGYQWWLASYRNKAIHSSRGLRGQYVISIPEDDIIIVRFGRFRSKIKKDHMPEDTFIYLDAAFDLLDL